jgi:hypothetical protein
MRFKTIVALLLFLAATGIVAVAMPASAVSTDNASTVNAVTGDKVTVAYPNGYTVTYIKVPAGTMRPMVVYDSITQGQTKYQTRYVNYYTESIVYDLYWGNPSNSLRLMITSPDGVLFGPVYDPYDGSYNGEICVQISRSGGIAQGTWTSQVYGYSVSGVQSFYI